MNTLKLQIITSFFVVFFTGQVYADAICDTCMDEKEKAQTVNLNASVNDAIEVVRKVNNNEDYNINTFNEDDRARLCGAVRSQTDSIKNPRFSYAEWELLELAGVKDLSEETSSSIREKIQKLWKEHHKKFECKDTIGLFPRGNYLKQLMGGHIKKQFIKYVRSYRVDPNIIDEVDGCTALDYVNARIKSTSSYTEETINLFKEYRDILLKHGAKSANELGGKC